jgi:hypothetical protein
MDDSETIQRGPAMRRDHLFRFGQLDALEPRQLLSTAHVAPVPVNVGGTLTVNVNDSSQSQNYDGSWTTTVPVSGTLAGYGKVKGEWATSVDSYGNYEGPDQIILQTKAPKGSFTIDFNNVNSGKPTKVSSTLGFYQHGQHLASGSGAFAHATESGSIELMDNLKKGDVTSIVLITVPPAPTTTTTNPT